MRNSEPIKIHVNHDDLSCECDFPDGSRWTVMKCRTAEEAREACFGIGFAPSRVIITALPVPGYWIVVERDP